MLAQAETEPLSFPMPCALCNRWVAGWRHYTDVLGGLGSQKFYCGECKASVGFRVALDAVGLEEVLEQGEEEAMVHYLYRLVFEQGRQADDALIRQWAARALRYGKYQFAFPWLLWNVRLCVVASGLYDPDQLPMTRAATRATLSSVGSPAGAGPSVAAGVGCYIDANMPEPGRIKNGYVRCRHCDPPKLLQTCPGLAEGGHFLCAVGNGWRRSMVGPKNWSCLQCATHIQDGFLKTGQKPPWLPEAWQLPMCCRVHFEEIRQAWG